MRRFTLNERDSRPRKLPFWNPQKVEESLPVVIGAGMTGSHVVLNLATMGFPKILVIDYDSLAITDLGKSLYPHRDAIKCRLKVDSLKAMAARCNPEMEVDTYAMHFSDFPKGVILDLMAQGLNIIPVISVDNRATMVQAATFFSSLGLTSYLGAITASQLKSQVYVIEPQPGGCFACTFNEADFAIMNTKISCLAGKHPETASPALNSVAEQCAAGVIHEVLRNIMPGLSRPAQSSYQISYTPLSGQMTSVLPCSETCRYHYPPQSGVLETAQERTLQSLFEEAASMMAIPIEQVVISFDFQNKDFHLQSYCGTCGQWHPIASLESHCPLCGPNGHILFGEDIRLLTISCLTQEMRDQSLSRSHFAAGELYLGSNTRQDKTILIRVKGQ